MKETPLCREGGGIYLLHRILDAEEKGILSIPDREYREKQREDNLLQEHRSSMNPRKRFFLLVFQARRLPACLRTCCIGREKKMSITIDIDGTIAGRHMQRFASTCNQVFDLNIAPECLASIRYKDFMCLPALRTYRQRVGEKSFQEALKQIEHAPAMLRALPPLPGAVQGVQQLSAFGPVAYYTVRKPEAEETTSAWLHQHEFPNAHHVIFCHSILNKLVRLAQFILETGEYVVLVDDLFERLREQFAALQAGTIPGADVSRCRQLAEVLRTHLLLVAFRASAPPPSDDGLQVFALPSWNQVHALTAFLADHVSE